MHPTPKRKWRWVKKYKGLYRVSTHGDVKSKKYGKSRILKPGVTTDGHLQVWLSKNGKVKGFLVHRLVLEAFVGPCPPGKQSRHYPDRDPTNNCVWNLSWSSATVNQKDRVEHGTHNRGERCKQAKLTRKQVRKIQRLTQKGVMQKKIAEKFGVNRITINRIQKGKSWKTTPKGRAR